MSIERLTQLHAEMGRIIAGMGGGASPGGAVASDRDLDSQYGDPEVRFDPKRWTGESWKGAKFSECPPAFLECLAEFFDWSAGKDEASGDPDLVKKAGYRRKDAARARGWARRNASKPQQPRQAAGLDGLPDTPTGGGDADDDIPFAPLDERLF
jgi:hypothetical protein